MKIRALALFGLLLCSGLVSAGNTLAKVRANQILRCGIADNYPGFAVADESGQWSGLNVDFCRAVAVAVLGDADKVKLIPLSPSARFPKLVSGQLDLLTHAVTMTFSREAVIGLKFAGPYFFDSTSFIVPIKNNIKRIEDLNNASICLIKGSTSESVLPDVFASKNLQYTPLLFENASDLLAAFFSDRCQAIMGVRSSFTALRSLAPASAVNYEIMADNFSKEPLAPVVRRDDDDWAVLVQWVLNALIEAEEQGITQNNVPTLLARGATPAQRRLLTETSALGQKLGLKSDWFSRVIGTVGNYGEIYERHFGRHGAVNIERGYNRLWKDGGLLYSPPFR